MNKYKIVLHTPLGVFETKEEEFEDQDLEVFNQFGESINKLNYFKLIDKDDNIMYFAGDLMKKSMMHIVKV